MRTVRVVMQALLGLAFAAPLLVSPSAGLAQETTPDPEADGEQIGPVFASDQWRVSVVAAVRDTDIDEVGLAPLADAEWIVVVADVSNWGNEDGTLLLQDFTVGSTDGQQDTTGSAGAATTTTDLNLRDAPSTDAQILTVMPVGTTVTLTGQEENGFLSVNLDGLDGWAAASNLAVGAGVAGPGGGIGVVPDAMSTVADELGIELDSTDVGVDIAADDTERVALVFQVPPDLEDPTLVRNTALPLDGALSRETSLEDVPPVVSPPTLDEAQVEGVVDGERLELLLDGEDDSQPVRLIGVDAPTGDDCFADEAADQLGALAGGTVYLERGVRDSVEDELVRYVWAEQDGVMTLLNHEMVVQGYAATEFAQQNDETRFEGWMTAAEGVATSQQAGLWAVCDGPHGEPAPTPTPSAEEIRAQYVPLVDVRELVIRPGGFVGEKIAFSGSVVTIQVAPAGDIFILGDAEPVAAKAAIQVQVAAHDGSTENVMVGYDGDTAGIFEESFVTVYATLVGTQTGTNAFGGTIIQPLLVADLVEIG